MLAYEDGRSLSLFDLRRPGDKPLLTLADDAITSATFDSKRRIVYLLRSEQLAALPFGSAELADALRERIAYCLSADEREDVLHEPTWLATRRAKACEASPNAP